jgi:hypothetical protein
MQQQNEHPAQTGTGRKYDGGKRRFDLIPWEVLDALADVLTFGAVKYEPNNWQHVPDGRNRYYAALVRHLQAWRSGERNDPESGMPHLAHAFICLAFLLWLELQGESDAGR